MEILKKLAKLATEIEYDDLPDDVKMVARQRVLDTVGALLCGQQYWTNSGKWKQFCRSLQPSGDNMAIDAMKLAAWAHAVELDDGHRNAGVHAGAVVIPVALVVGQNLNRSGRDLLVSVVLGYEAVYRVAVVMGPNMLQRGFHPSAVCDAFGAAMTAGKLMRLDEEQLTGALGMAGLFAGGLFEAVNTAPNNKCIMVCRSALNGIHGAQMSIHGLYGPPDILESKHGLFQVMAAVQNSESAVEGIGKRFLITDTYTKLYPTCRHTQPAIDALVELMAGNDLRPTDLVEIEVGTHAVAWQATGRADPPRTMDEAKFSMAYCLAVAAYEGTVDLSHLQEPYINDPRYGMLMKRILVVESKGMNDCFPARRGAKVRLKCRDGRHFERVCFAPKGSPERPAHWEDLAMKLRAASEIACIDEIVDIIEHLEDVDDLKRLRDLVENRTEDIG